MTGDQSPIRVLHVDDDPEFTALAATFLEREDDRFDVETAEDVAAGLESLTEAQFHCVVSDFDMPGRDGIEFLEAVREGYPDLPFILVTGKGSEEIASEAISAGVTDYMQKAGGTEQFEVLGHRIRNAVARHRVQEAERRAEVLLETSPIPTLVEVGREVVYANEAAVDLLGATEPAELIDLDIVAMTHPDDVDAVLADIAEVETTGEWLDGVERRWQTLDGDPLTVEVIARPITWDGADGHLVIARDVGERIEREAALERQNDLFRQAQALANVGGWEYDVSTGEAMWTDQVSRLHGLPTAVTPSPELSLEHYHPADRPAIEAAFERAVEAGEPYDITARFVTADGEPRWVRTRGEPQLEDGEVVRIRGTIQDVTDREELQAELRTVNDRVELALDVTDSIIFEADPTTGYEQHHGPFERVFGLPSAAIDSTDTFYELAVHPDDRAALVARQTAVAEGQRDDHTIEYRTNPENGDIRWLRSEAYLADGDEGDRNRLVGLATDITALKAREAELEAQIDRLDEFASIVSHDLRNPLSVAMGRLELARESGSAEEFEAVERAHARMVDLIDDLLGLARSGADAAELEPVALDAVARACWGDVESQAATLTVETDRRLMADRRQLEQLLTNLLGNAVVHGGPGVTVRVEELADGYSIEDDGPGIEPADRGRAFDSGFSTDPAGTGFGLTIVKRVAEAHGWSVSLGEGTDCGTRFEITGVEWAPD